MALMAPVRRLFFVLRTAKGCSLRLGLGLLVVVTTLVVVCFCLFLLLPCQFG